MEQYNPTNNPRPFLPAWLQAYRDIEEEDCKRQAKLAAVREAVALGQPHDYNDRQLRRMELAERLYSPQPGRLLSEGAAFNPALSLCFSKVEPD